MQIAKISQTGEIVTAVEVLSRSNTSRYVFECPSCYAELSLVSNKITRVNPHFRAKAKQGHDPRCEYYSAPREAEFMALIQSLLNRHPKYSVEGVHSILGDKVYYRADLNIKRQSDNTSDHLLIECKKLPPFGMHSAENMMLQITSYLSFVKGYKGVVCFPGTISDEEKEIFIKNGIEVWDLDYLANEFGKYLGDDLTGRYVETLRARVSVLGGEFAENKLIDDLQSCKYGRKYCYVYQDLVGQILTHLFTPPWLNLYVNRLTDPNLTVGTLYFPTM